MWTQEKINNFINYYKIKINNTKSEIKELPKLLNEKEELFGIIEGNLKSIAGRKQAGLGICVITSKRIIFFRKSIIGTTTFEEIPLHKISSASFRSGLVFGSVSITSNSNEALIENCDKNNGASFAKVITNLINEENNKPQVSAQISQPDNYDKLEKLFSLKEKGIITEEEFNTQKSVLLNNL